MDALKMFTIKPEMNMSRIVDKEDGFVLVLAMIFMVVLSLMAVIGIRSTSVELQISGNERVAKDNLYQAEAVANEGAQKTINKKKVEDLLPALGAAAAGSIIITVVDDEDDMANVDTDGDGDIEVNGEDSMVISALDPDATDYEIVAQVVTLNQISSGSSLALGSSRLYSYTAYGYSERARGKALVKLGFKKRF